MRVMTVEELRRLMAAPDRLSPRDHQRREYRALLRRLLLAAPGGQVASDQARVVDPR